eukprot:g306.t1
MFRTEFQGFSCEYSPFNGRLLAIATSQYFGIVGNGKLYVVDVDSVTSSFAPLTRTRHSQITRVRSFYTQDGIFDCSWSEVNNNQLITAVGDGTVKLWDLQALDQYPLRSWNEHTAECCGVDWNLVTKSSFLSCSWDHTAKLYDPLRQQSLRSFVGHTHCVYGIEWNPHHSETFATVSGDRYLNIWDVREQHFQRCQQSILAHEHEVLTVDWHKYKDLTVATGSADHTVKEWDLRTAKAPIRIMRGHTFPVRKVKYSPHDPDLLASTSYDLSVRLWRFGKSDVAKVNHSEFVCGLDFNLFIKGQVATCAWDRLLYVWGC